MTDPRFVGLYRPPHSHTTAVEPEYLVGSPGAIGAHRFAAVGGAREPRGSDILIFGHSVGRWLAYSEFTRHQPLGVLRGDVVLSQEFFYLLPTYLRALRVGGLLPGFCFRGFYLARVLASLGYRQHLLPRRPP